MGKGVIVGAWVGEYVGVRVGIGVYVAFGIGDDVLLGTGEAGLPDGFVTIAVLEVVFLLE